MQTEKILDSLYKSCQTKGVKKPRTYRKKARKDYLKVAKKRRPSRQERRRALAKQLQYIKRNLFQIEKLINSGADLSKLSPRKSTGCWKEIPNSNPKPAIPQKGRAIV